MTTIIDHPRPADVICGRGKNSFRHEGNDVFRQLIVEHVDSYKTASPKKEKSQVVMLVVTTVIGTGGRFLVRDDETNGWLDGGVKQGQKKTGHAFRDALRGRVKSLATEQQIMARHKSRHTSSIDRDILEATVQAAHEAQINELKASGFKASCLATEKQKKNGASSAPVLDKHEKSDQAADTTTTQVNDFELKMNGLCATVEPSSDWMVPRKIDAELTTYLRDLFHNDLRSPAGLPCSIG